MTAILFTIGKSVISLYVGSTGVASSYGAAGALLIIVIAIARFVFGHDAAEGAC